MQSPLVSSGPIGGGTRRAARADHSFGMHPCCNHDNFHLKPLAQAAAAYYSRDDVRDPTWWTPSRAALQICGTWEDDG